MSSGIKVPTLIMTTGVGQIPAPGQPGNLSGTLSGWITGNPANLAASGTADVWFDLGPDWHQYVIGVLTVYVLGPSTGLNPIQVFGADNYLDGINYSRRLGFAYATAGTTTYQNVATGSSPTTFNLRLGGRFVRITALNADAVNATGANSAFTLMAQAA